MDEEIKKQALTYLEGQHLQGEYQPLREATTHYIGEIPISRIGLKHCPVCESVSCGVCGQCHENDRRFLFVGMPCPMAVPNGEDTLCVAWSWAYQFIRDAERVLTKKSG